VNSTAAARQADARGENVYWKDLVALYPLFLSAIGAKDGTLSLFPLLHRTVLVCILFCALAQNSNAADPQPYNVTIEPSVSSDIDSLLNSSSLLVTLRDTAPVPPFGLIARATGDVQRLSSVLNSFGYYNPAIAITIEGRPLDDPMLPPLLDQAPQGTAVNVQVAIEEGALYRLRRITLEGTIPPAAEQTFGLSPGAPAIGANVAAARDRLLTALQDDGYALATVSEPIAYADDPAAAIDIQLRVETGPQVQIGSVAFQGLERVNESFARGAFPLAEGERFRPSRIETARRELLETGVFSTVTVRAANQATSGGRLALTIEVQERPRRAVNLGGAYSTDLGISLSASWTHRNLFGNAEQLILSAAGTGLWGNATDDVGYQFAARFTLILVPALLHGQPDGFHRRLTRRQAVTGRVEIEMTRPQTIWAVIAVVDAGEYMCA